MIDEPWEEAERAFEEEAPRWPLSWRGLYPRERWMWFEQLWADVVMLRERYRLPVRSGWWENQVQVETLAALAAWVERYDSGEWDDPPGKLALLQELEHIASMLGEREAFQPKRERRVFEAHLLELGCAQPTDGGGA